MSIKAKYMAKNCASASELGSWKLETRNWKMETGKWKLESGDQQLRPGVSSFCFPISSFQSPVSGFQQREVSKRGQNSPFSIFQFRVSNFQFPT
jgi:hypothetical protein